MRILMRAQLQHDKVFKPEDVLLGNLMGGNIGNWLYQYSLFRALMVDENTQIDIFNPTKQKVTDRFIQQVNESYDLFVLPLANAFKLSFIDEMKALTKFINGLKIPCIVPGIGIQAKLGVDFNERYEYAQESKDFIKAILEKSSIIGLRGESTADFFRHLGFLPEQDYTVIGCPSLYTHGLYLPRVKELSYGEESAVLFSSKVEHENKKVSKLLSSLASQHPNYYYAPQRMSDMLIGYYGADYRDIAEEKQRFFNRDKSLIFTSPYSWIDYLSKNIDLSVGTRIHGNVAAVLAGVPAYIIALDQRVSELADYHNIACVPIDKVDKNLKLRDIAEKTDFTRIHKGHDERFGHFVDFLEKNGLETAYSKDRQVREVYFDKVIAGLDFPQDVKAFGTVSPTEQIKRLHTSGQFYYDLYTAEREKKKAEAERFREEIAGIKERERDYKAAAKEKEAELKNTVNEKNAEIKRLKVLLADAESKKGLKGILKTVKRIIKKLLFIK